MKQLNNQDAAYIAGLFDGEGCVGYYDASRTYVNRPSYFHTSVHVCGVDPRVIYWLRSTTGIGNINCYRGKGKRRMAYQWQLGNKSQVILFLTTIRPFLKVKDTQVDVLLAHLNCETSYVKRHGSVTNEIVESRQRTADKLKELKRIEYLEGVETRQAEPLVH